MEAKNIPVLGYGDIGTVDYFWTEKGDLERAIIWPDIAAKYPALAEEWSEYKRATEAATKRFQDFFDKMRDVASDDPNT